MKKKILIALVALLIVFFTALFVHRFWFEFDNHEVKKYLSEEANKFGANASHVYNELDQLVDHILKSSDMTQGVRMYSRLNGIPKEKVLVDRAIGLAKALTIIN